MCFASSAGKSGRAVRWGGGYGERLSKLVTSYVVFVSFLCRHITPVAGAIRHTHTHTHECLLPTITRKQLAHILSIVSSSRNHHHGYFEPSLFLSLSLNFALGAFPNESLVDWTGNCDLGNLVVFDDGALSCGRESTERERATEHVSLRTTDATFGLGASCVYAVPRYPVPRKRSAPPTALSAQPPGSWGGGS